MASKKPRCIWKADKCLVPMEQSQELLARSHIRFVRNVMNRKYQLHSYLKLVEIHISNGTVPPGLCINITPPGYSKKACDSNFLEWTSKTRQCSRDLVTLLRKKYLEDLGKCDNLVSYSRKQLTAIISGLKGKGDKCAEREASEIIAKIAREAERELMQRFDKVSCDRGADEYGVGQPNVSARTASDSEMIEDQARSQRRSSLDSRKTYDNIYPGRNSYDAYGFRHGAEDTFFGTSSFSGQFSRNDAFSSHTKDRIEAEEEEMKYLEFINTVTNDILTRGVYSDRVLTQVMERHVIANRDRLEEGRMRLMLKKLLQDIGVSPGSTEERFETSSEYSTKYNHVYSVPRRSSSRDRTTSRKSYKAAKESSVDLSDGDHFTPKPKKRGILKSSSGSDLDRRSALSSGDEKERESESRVENKTEGTESDMNMAELAEVLDSAETPPLSRKSVSIEEGLNEAGSIKSDSTHSLAALRSNSKTSDQQRDSDDF